jgi:soluble P-type ATPase
MIGTLRASDVYMDMLATLSNEDKLDLISELVKSMKKVVKVRTESKDIFANFSSDWGGDMTTEEYADMLRSENVENGRTVDSW